MASSLFLLLFGLFRREVILSHSDLKTGNIFKAYKNHIIFKKILPFQLMLVKELFKQ